MKDRSKINKNFVGGYIIVSILFLLLNNVLFAIELPVKIAGRILNAENSEPISNAVIQIIDLNIYTTSKKDGSFEIGPITTKTFRIKLTHLGFQEKLIDIDLEEEKDKKIVVYLFPKTINLNPVIVSGERNSNLIDELQEYNYKLSGKDLHQKLGQNLAITLKNEAGISLRSMGPAPSRPVFRGLGQDRVLITEDGMKSIDLSATSPDHAVTIEPFNSERMEVLRGPKILTFTSSSIGGVINVIREEIPDVVHNTIHFLAGSYYESVNKGLLGSFKFDAPIKPFQFRVMASQRKTSDLSTPIGILKNSFSKNHELSAGSSFIKDFGFVGSGFRIYQLEYGIPGGFIGAHPYGVNIQIAKRQFSVNSKFKWDNEKKSINIKYNYDYYRHKEFEKSGLIGSEFRINTNSGRITYDYENDGILSSGEIGFSFEHRNFEIGGYVFTPPTTSFNLSSFIYQDFHLKRLSVDGALRLSYDVVDPKVKKTSPRIGEIRKREFFNLSAVVSVIYKLTDVVYTGLSLSRSTRVPTIEELFSEGPHLAAYSYEVGNPDLSSEKGWGSEAFVYHRFDKLDFNLNVFYNHLDSYIIPRNTGRINYQTFLPIYATSGVAARLYGFEAGVNIKYLKFLSFQFSVNHTIGEFRETKKPLPQIPPTKGINSIKFIKENFEAGISNEWALSQKRVDEFEQPTPGYSIVNLYSQYLITYKTMVLVFVVSMDNVFNKEYRNHLSRIKSVYPEAGRNFRLTMKVMM